jgi:NADH dehydrogenase (ubiquinone) Fe-S protein 8
VGHNLHRFSMMPAAVISRGSLTAALRQVPSSGASKNIRDRCSAVAALQRRGYATPHGPPPKDFRLPAPKRWDEEKQGTFDKLGKFFLLTEMARGMYVVLEQFFRPP